MAGPNSKSEPDLMAGPNNQKLAGPDSSMHHKNSKTLQIDGSLRLDPTQKLDPTH